MTTEPITDTGAQRPAAGNGSQSPELTLVDAAHEGAAHEGAAREEVAASGADLETVDGEGADAAVDIDLNLLDATLDYIRPALQADGGDMVLLGVENGVVTLQMVGACGGCPMSMMTLRAGIERILIDRVPGIREVVAL